MIDLQFFFRLLIFPGFFFVLLLTLFCDWFERKIEARMQNRVGPSFTGPAGILQPLADFTKLLTKEDIVPVGAKGVLFRFSPIFAFSTFILTLTFLPIDGTAVMPSFEGDLIFVLTLVSVANFFLFVSGWSSTNPYSAIGATRVLTQFLGYDIPLFIIALTPAFLINDLRIAVIASSQHLPFVVIIPWAFILLILALQAELEKDPFDVPHAETEIVGGYETEYTGRRLAFLKLAKDVQILLGSAMVVVLFLGGPYGPVLFDLPGFWYTVWFIIKLLLVLAITEFLTSIFARLRIDQVMVANWKVLLPLSILSLAATVIMTFWLDPLL